MKNNEAPHSRRMLALKPVLLLGLATAFATASPEGLAADARRTRPERIPGILQNFRWEGTIPISGTPVPQFRAVDEAVEQALREKNIVGCGVALLENDRVVYCRGFGWAEIDKTPFLPTTACRIGSLSKALTGMTALRLYDAGLLQLDDLALPLLAKAGIKPFRKPGATMDPRLQQITVRDLLDHTSGFARSAPSGALPSMVHEMGKTQLNATDVVSYVLGTTQLVRNPGSAYEYSNINFVMAARVIEAVTKTPYEEVVRSYVLTPMGISTADAFISPLQRSPEDPVRRPNEVHYYQWSPEVFRSLIPHDPRREVSEPYGGLDPKSSDGAGGWAMSITGLATFVSNIVGSHSILADKARTALLTPPAYAAKDGTTFRSNNFYSKGMWVHLSRGFPQIESGGMLKHAGAVYAPLDVRYTVVAVSNCNLAQEPWIDVVLREAVGKGVKQIPGPLPTRPPRDLH
jgi:CubicO group peptidase (beta-lactamase class C family)